MRTPRCFRARCALSLLLFAAMLPGMLFIGAPTGPVSANHGTTLGNERIVFRGKMYEVYVSNGGFLADGSPDPNNKEHSIVVCEKELTNDACVTTTNLGGVTQFKPIIAAAADGSFMSVLVRTAGNEIAFRTMKADGTRADTGGATCPGGEPTLANFSCWGVTPKYPDGTPMVQVADNLVGYGNANTIIAVYKDASTGYRLQVFSPDGGLTYTNVDYSLGLSIPAGTNILGPGLSQADKDALLAMHPVTVRVRMRVKAGDPRRFNLADLDWLHNEAKVRALIIDGSDIGYDWTTFSREAAEDLGGGVRPIDLGRRWNDTVVIWELGNEPDRDFVGRLPGEPPSGYDRTNATTARQTSDADAANKRDAALATANNFYRGEGWRNDTDPYKLYGAAVTNPNFRLMVSLPTRNPDGRVGGAEEAQSYFDIFTGPNASGARVGYDFSFVAVHAYSNNCLKDVTQDPAPNNVAGAAGEGTGSPIDIVRQAAQRSNRPLYITEAGINESLAELSHLGITTQAQRWEELGRRYAFGLSGFDLPDGRVRGVHFYETALNQNRGGDNVYTIDGDEANGSWIGSYPGHSRIGNAGQSRNAPPQECGTTKGARTDAAGNPVP